MSNATRIQISYQELFAARMHAEKILNEYTASYNDMAFNLENDVNSTEYLKSELDHTKDMIGVLYELLASIDNRFIQQARFIEHQIDVNFPEV